LWKWLSRAVREGHVRRPDSGTRKEPYKYFLPGIIEKWQANFLAEFTRDLERGAVGTPRPGGAG
jgi:hypothetical protein